jgi:hypothetical protein
MKWGGSKTSFFGTASYPGENCMSRKFLPYKELAIFSRSLVQNQAGFGTSSSMYFPKPAGFGKMILYPRLFYGGFLYERE